MMVPNSIQRTKVLQVYTDALNPVRGDVCVQNYLQSEQFKLRLSENEKIAILAIGKAAQSMAQGAYSVLNDTIVSGLVVTKQDHLLAASKVDCFEYFESSHPIPSEKSLEAGLKVIDFISGLAADTHLVVLISGGASALVEQLKPGISLDDLIRVNDWLLASGLTIEAMNSIRQKLSMIKGGKLALMAKHLKVSNLLLSDVLSNEPAYIGSGLFVPVLEIKSVPILPDWLESLLVQCEPIKLEISETDVFTALVATNSLLLKNISENCQPEKSETVVVVEVPLSGKVEMEAAKIVTQIKKAESGFTIWGGEPTVDLSSGVGHVAKGGRNQHLALLIADKIKTMTNIVVLCIGTDGTDGSTGDAGALVDGNTVLRGEVDGLDVGEHINNFNSAEFLHVSGDVINTGPTGTNVMDVVIAYKWE